MTTNLFDLAPDWTEHWQGMPEFAHEDLKSWASVGVALNTEAARKSLQEILGQTVTKQTRSLWFPKAEIWHYADRQYKALPLPHRPLFPLYIVSKGRYDNGLTFGHLEAMGLDYNVVVEEQEVEKYRPKVKGRILTLDKRYQREYDPLDGLGDSKSKGSGPARNFAWEHSMSEGHAWHWVMDDNIDGFYRFNNNLKVPCADGTVFRCMEDFMLRYENTCMGGPNYFMFAPRKEGRLAPFTLNTRIYSCNLIRNDIPFRWRGRYNEDTLLSLDILKAGLATVLFNAFLQYKITTQTMKGGNTTEIYASGTLAKSQLLVDMHPDVARLAYRWGRWHHYVDYGPFARTRLQRRADLELLEGTNNYGMVLQLLETLPK